MKPWDDFSRKELIELVEQLTEQSKTEESQLAAAEKERDAARAELNDLPNVDPTLREIGAELADLLDEDRWNGIEPKLLAVAQRLAAAEKRASEAEAKAAQQQAITASEIVMLLEGMAGDRRYDCLSRSKFVEIADEFKRIYPRAQAVAEVLANAKEIYSDHNANDPRDEDASDCWCGTCNAVRKLAALDKEK